MPVAPDAGLLASVVSSAVLVTAAAAAALRLFSPFKKHTGETIMYETEPELNTALPEETVIPQEETAAAPAPRVPRQLCFLNRELSWLKFNERVLEEAADEHNPLCERLTFLSIFQTNLDEFFSVRVASLKDMIHAKYTKTDMAGMTPEAQLSAISTTTPSRRFCRPKGTCTRIPGQSTMPSGMRYVNTRSTSSAAISTIT